MNSYNFIFKDKNFRFLDFSFFYNNKDFKVMILNVSGTFSTIKTYGAQQQQQQCSENNNDLTTQNKYN